MAATTFRGHAYIITTGGDDPQSPFPPQTLAASSLCFRSVNLTTWEQCSSAPELSERERGPWSSRTLAACSKDESMYFITNDRLWRTHNGRE